MRNQEYSFEDAGEKSKKFLKDIVGKEIYDKFIKDGKIEIESGKNVYELYLDGRVINKTANQKYCIVPNRPDYPNYDVVAIKYAWLKYKIKTVEKVANKTVIIPSYGPDRSIGYDAYVHYMEENGWTREQIIINELNTNLVTTNSVQAGNTGNMAQIRCPAGRMMSFMGITQVPENMDRASHISLNVTDTDGNEIRPYTKIRITKIKQYLDVVQLVRCFYSDISSTRHAYNSFDERYYDGKSNLAYKTNHELWRWKFGVALYEGDCLDIHAINSETAIRSENVKINMECDFWGKRILNK